MTTGANKQTLEKSNKKDSLVNSVRILSNITLRDIEKSYDINNVRGTEAYYSNRYGTILRRTIE